LKSKALFSAGIEHVGGDMYASVPKGDAIMMKVSCSLAIYVTRESTLQFSCIILQSICHNWSDGQCIQILKNCHEALQQSGKLIIIDYVMPEAPESTDAAKFVSTIDNSMLAMFGGKERTEKEFKAMSKTSGFSGFQVICRVYNVLGVMELYK
jgi:hypothetical protein